MRFTCRRCRVTCRATLRCLALTLQAVVAAVDDSSVTIDANHPLAGKELTFDVSQTRFAHERWGRLGMAARGAARGGTAEDPSGSACSAPCLAAAATLLNY